MPTNAAIPEDTRTAVVTGATSGIGRAIAERLAAAGLTVVPIDPPKTTRFPDVARRLWDVAAELTGFEQSHG